MYIVGLTGPIGAGKTTVAQYLKEMGAIVINADQIGHDLMHKQGIKDQIEEGFSAAVFTDGSVDRKKLAEKAFKSREALNKLNKIMWPPIIKIIEEELQLHSKMLPANEIIVLDAALILDAGLSKFTNLLVAVISDRKEQVKRLIEKDFSKDGAEARIKMQMPKDKLLEQCDYIVTNNADLISLKKETKKLWHFIKKQKA